MKKINVPPLISRAQQYGSIPGLEAIKNLLQELGNPQEKLQIIHIAGTNGKGSIASFIQGMLLENDYNVGLFTSPYFDTPREMIQYNQNLIPKKTFEQYIAKIESAIERMLQKEMAHPTEFEIYVALAFEYFAEIDTDYVILEVGLGGRMDATNIIKNPVLTIISHIALDHTEFLGNTLEKIAEHKGGIIKPKIPVIVYPQEPEVHRVLEKIATSKDSPFYSFNPNNVKMQSSALAKQCFSVEIEPTPETWVSRQGVKLSNPKTLFFPGVTIQLLGKHQVFNATTALLAMIVLLEKKPGSLTLQKMLRGLYNTRWPGRFEILGRQPLTVVDGAHNVDAAKALADTLNTHCSKYSITLILGILEDKDVKGFLREIIPFVSRIIVTRPLSPRALDPEKLKEKILSYGPPVLVESSIPKACSTALEITAADDMILAVGSLYMIGEARQVFIKHFSKQQ